MPLRKGSPPSRHLRSPLNGHVPSTPHFFQSPVNSPLPSPSILAQNPFTDALETPAQTLGSALIKSLECVERTVALAFHQGDPPARLFSWSAPSSTEPDPVISEPEGLSVKKNGGWTFLQLADIQKAESELTVARDTAREKLRDVFEQIYSQKRVEDTKVKIPKDAMNCSLAMIALLQVCLALRPLF